MGTKKKKEKKVETIFPLEHLLCVCVVKMAESAHSNHLIHLPENGTEKARSFTFNVSGFG